MLLKSKQIIDLPVYTQSNDFLGKINSFSIDQETQQVVNYEVSSSSWLQNLIGQEKTLLISVGQVVELTAAKMIVLDAVVKETAKGDLAGKPFQKQPLPAASLQKELS